MTEYILGGKDEYGKEITERVEAGTIEEAIEQFKNKGVSDIIVHSDDFMAETENMFALDEKTKNDVKKYVTAEDAVFLKQELNFIQWTSYLIKKSWKSFVFTIAYIIWHYTTGLSWGVVDSFVIIFLLYPAISFVSHRQTYLYNQLLNALEYNKWDVALKIIPKIEKTSWWTGNKIPPFELAVRKAQALTGKGNIHEGLKLVTPFEKDEKIQKWMYLTRLISIYDIAKKYDKSIELYHEALKLKPDASILYIDLAVKYAMRKKDIRNAKMAIQSAEKYVIPDMAKHGLLLAKGIIEYESRNYKSAQDYLLEAKKDSKRNSKLSGMNAFFKLQDTYLCLISARLNDQKAALQYYDIVKDYLVTIDEPKLLEICRKAVGQ